MDVNFMLFSIGVIAQIDERRLQDFASVKRIIFHKEKCGLHGYKFYIQVLLREAIQAVKTNQ